MLNRVRLNRLENRHPSDAGKVTLIVREYVGRKSDGSTSSQLASAFVIGSEVRLFRDDYASDGLFWDSVKKTHLQVHGTSINECKARQPEFATDQDSIGAIQ